MYQDLHKCVTREVALNNTDMPSARYYKLPFIGHASNVTENKIKALMEWYCNPNIVIKRVVTSCKVGSYFSTRDFAFCSIKSN